VDVVWHKAILNTKFYKSLQNILQQEIHHRPEGASEQEDEQRKERRKRTQNLEGLVFGRNIEQQQRLIPLQTQLTIEK
jgi:hypothetical protein